MSLDTNTNRTDREREKASKPKPEDLPLNPPFPYKRLPFDPFFFGLDTEPKENKPTPIGSGSL